MKEIENGLIPVYENEKGNRLVNARELHEFLEVDTRFNDWICDRIKKYEFVKNVDFTSFTEKSVKPQGGRPTEEYILTLDTAKEISMVQNNEKGKQARKYFIAVEKKYKAKNTQSFTPPEQPPILNTMNVVKFIADDLRVSTSSRVKMYRQVCENEGINSNFLPDYTDEKAGRSATELLKKFNISMSTVKFNKLMLEHEFLQEETRTSTNRQGFKKYKSLTDKGLKYGKNKASTHGSEKETQPLYYEDTFIELVNILSPLKEVI